MDTINSPCKYNYNDMVNIDLAYLHSVKINNVYGMETKHVY